MPISSSFLQDVAPLYSASMGTEHAAELLYALVRFTRPTKLLEIGSGYTTLFLLKALADNVESFDREITELNAAANVEQGTATGMFLPTYYSEIPRPKLVSIDALTHRKTTADKVKAVVDALGLSRYLEFVVGDYASTLPGVLNAFRPLDLAWMDCGSYANFVYFQRHIWPHMNPDGGLVLLHSTETNLEGQLFIHRMKIRQATREFSDFEMCSLLEPHKKRQNSIAIFRMTSQLADRHYSTRG